MIEQEVRTVLEEQIDRLYSSLESEPLAAFGVFQKESTAIRLLLEFSLDKQTGHVRSLFMKRKIDWEQMDYAITNAIKTLIYMRYVALQPEVQHDQENS